MSAEKEDMPYRGVTPAAVAEGSATKQTVDALLGRPDTKGQSAV